MAVDIHVKDFLLSDLLLYAKELGFNGIGFYEKKISYISILGLDQTLLERKNLIGY